MNIIIFNLEYHPQNIIILANELVIFPDGNDTISLAFFIKSSIKKFLLLGVCYGSKPDTKLIFLGMPNWKGLSYSSQKGIFEVQDNMVPVMIGYLTSHNWYKLSLETSNNNFLVIFSLIMTTDTSKSTTNLFV